MWFAALCKEYKTFAEELSIFGEKENDEETRTKKERKKKKLRKADFSPIF
jgi:hypothetical protein